MRTPNHETVDHKVNFSLCLKWIKKNIWVAEVRQKVYEEKQDHATGNTRYKVRLWFITYYAVFNFDFLVFTHFTFDIFNGNEVDIIFN